MNDQPVFIITISSRDVTGYARHWIFIDDDEAQSEIEVELANPQMRLSGAFDYGDDLQIRFGYGSNMGGAAYLPVAEVKERYPTGSELLITVIGRDESTKLGGSKKKGVKGENERDQEIMKKLAKEDGARVFAEGEDTRHKKAYVMNENTREATAKYGKCIRRKQSPTGKNPKSPFGDQGAGHLFSSAERIPEDGEHRDVNRGGNHSDQHRGAPITGALKLKGYPTLRAKANVTVVGVGGKASGTYYVQKVRHEWDLQGGFISEAELMRGGSGSGAVGDAQPTVAYADIWKRGEIYIGPRKMDGPSQATFRYGDAQYLMEFIYHLHPQQNRHAGEGAEGEGIDLRDKGEAFKAEKAAGEAAMRQEAAQ